ncbi:MAG TPA: UDP-2,3-diacylglucosamine diphosphatase [Pseudomonadales bacterium]|nr:UDP-2,3-diacylglucosamine diphosphatase [Pseudomonadales bacterium]
MNRLFISDLHLSEERPHITAAFFAFLDNKVRLADKAVGCDELYILGDFFDAWIGDDDDRPLAADIAQALKKVAETGVRIFFQHGNRDFLLGEDYALQCGMRLLPALHIIEQKGQRILLAHGDQFCTQDVAYQQFRTLVRNPEWQQDFLAKPIEERRAIAAQLRAKSKEANSIKAEDIMDVTPSEIDKVLIEQQCNTLIHGHTHRPARHALVLPNGDKAERIVLSDWVDVENYFSI